MAFDQNRYFSLIQRAAFDASFYKGTIQDLSSAQRAMSFVGAPTWARVNGRPCLSLRGGAYVRTTVAVAPVIPDLTAQVAYEALFVMPSATGLIDYLFHQQGAAPGGGVSLGVFDTTLANQNIYMHGIPAGGGNGRYLAVAAGSCPNGRMAHVVQTAENTFTSGRAWVNGIARTVTLSDFNPPAVSLVATIRAGGYGFLVPHGVMIVRVWQGVTFTNEDAQVLYQAARELTSGEV